MATVDAIGLKGLCGNDVMFAIGTVTTLGKFTKFGSHATVHKSTVSCILKQGRARNL
jgi:hypothetical protein